MKKVLSALLSLLVIISALSALPFSASALSASGELGKNVAYTYDKSTGAVVISGTGKTDNYDNYTHSPFYYNKKIKSVVIENGVTSIGAGLFDYCTELTTVSIPDGVSVIGDNAFRHCNMESIRIPFGVTKIGEEAFCCCDQLKSISVPDSVTSIGSSAFDECLALKKVKLSENLTKLSECIFAGCTSLKEISIPDAVTEIGGQAFASTAITSMHIPAGVKKISGDGFYIFENCQALKKITVSSKNKNYDSRNNCNAIIKTKSNTLIAACQNTKIPNTVKAIGHTAFMNVNITSITIPNSVTKIESAAFLGCASLKSVKLPKNLKTVESFLFADCKALESIDLPDSVTVIGEDAFINCVALESVELPANLQEICNYAFSTCKKLHDIVIPNKVKSIGCKAFIGCNNLKCITVPKSVKKIGYAAFEEDAIYSASSSNISDVYYTGTKSDWKKIKTSTRDNEDKYNSYFKKVNDKAKMHYRACTHHKWNKGKVKSQPTFTSVGRTVHTCTACGAKHTTVEQSLGTPSLSGVTAGKKSFTAKWKKVSRVDGYQVQYSTDAAMKKDVKSVKVKQSATSQKAEKLKAKKTYYVRIRAYKTVKGKKVYSSWSKIKTVKTK